MSQTTGEPSCMCCRVGACRRFGNIYKRLGNRVRDLQSRYQDPYFEVSEKSMEINKNPEFFSPLFSFFFAQYISTPHGNVIPLSAFFSGTSA